MLTTKQVLETKTNQVLFSVNPYSNTNQREVKIQTIIISYIKEGRVHGYSTSFLEAQEWVKFSGFATDMTIGVKGMFDNFPEALEFLGVVHSGYCSRVVEKHHNIVAALDIPFRRNL